MMDGFGIFIFVCSIGIGFCAAGALVIAMLIRSSLFKGTNAPEKKISIQHIYQSRVCWYFGLASFLCALPTILVTLLGVQDFVEQSWIALLVYLPLLIGMLCSAFAGLAFAGELLGMVLAEDARPNWLPTFAGLLLAFCLPGLGLYASSQMTSTDRRIDDLNKLRQLALASHNFESAHREFPGISGTSRGSGAGLSWRVHLLPFLEHAELYERFRLDEPWDSPHNSALIEEMPDVFASLWPTETVPIGHTLFQRPVGNGAFDPGDGNGISFSEIADGTSETLMILQVNPATAVVWTKPADYCFNPKNPLWNLGSCGRNVKAWLGATCDGCTYVFENCDFEAMSPEEISAVFTRAGGDLVPEKLRLR